MVCSKTVSCLHILHHEVLKSFNTAARHPVDSAPTLPLHPSPGVTWTHPLWDGLLWNSLISSHPSPWCLEIFQHGQTPCGQCPNPTPHPSPGVTWTHPLWDGLFWNSLISSHPSPWSLEIFQHDQTPCGQCPNPTPPPLPRCNMNSPSMRWFALKQSHIFTSFTMKSWNLSTWSDALRTVPPPYPSTPTQV